MQRHGTQHNLQHVFIEGGQALSPVDVFRVQLVLKICCTVLENKSFPPGIVWKQQQSRAPKYSAVYHKLAQAICVLNQVALQCAQRNKIACSTDSEPNVMHQGNR